VSEVDSGTETEGAHHSIAGKDIPREVLVFRVFGPVFFGAIDKLETALQGARRKPKIYILRMRKVPALDASGITALETLYAKIRKNGRHLILSGLPPKPVAVLRNAGFIDKIGVENVCQNIDDSLKRAREILAAL